jgi:hypothetical protein
LIVKNSILRVAKRQKCVIIFCDCPNARRDKNKVIGFDLFILAIASTSAIILVGFAAKAYDIVRKDWNKS